MTSDPDEWEAKNVLNPFTALTPYDVYVRTVKEEGREVA
jgi:hypothetical protein